MTEPTRLEHITQSFAKRFKEGTVPTCVALSDYSVIMGTTAGIVFVYDKDTEKFHSLFREEGKDFHNNSVTCIDVHPHRAEYVVTGHRMG